VVGCNRGVDLAVSHKSGAVTIRAKDGTEATVTATEWRDSVVSFVDEVQTFYDREPPRRWPEEEPDASGWDAFWREWRQRRADANDRGR
jgi:hypothetical protein